MNAKNNAACVAEPAEPCLNQFAEVESLKSTIQCMDAIAHDAFSKIRASAKLALLSMETPDGQRLTDNLAYVIELISTLADDAQNSIGCEAESVGCSYVDDSAHRRGLAYHLVKQGQQQ